MMDQYNRIVKKTMERNIPFIVHWELTYRCNLKCSHCYCLHHDEKEEFTLTEIKSVIDKLAGMQSLYITFSGGEIFVRKDFFAIARYARIKGFALRLLTNGTSITGRVADDIKQIHPLSVEMSLYASNPGLHDNITGVRGSFEKTVEAFRLLRERGVRATVKSLLMRQNANQLGGLRKLSHELGAGLVYDFIVIPGDDGTKDPLSFRVDEKEIPEIFREDEDAVSFEPLQKVDDDTFMCSAGLNNISISPYGDVSPCVGMKERAGNLREQSLEEITNSEVLHKVRSTKFSDLWACRECRIAPYCRRCPGLAAAEDGDYLGPSTAACRMANALRAAGNVKAGLEV